MSLDTRPRLRQCAGLGFFDAPLWAERNWNTSALNGMKLLIVDDDAPFRETIARRLRRLGHEVVEAGSGADALVLFAKRRFEVALIDLMMPGFPPK